MNSDNLKGHLQRIEKYMHQTEKNFRVTSNIALIKLRSLADKLLHEGKLSLPPVQEIFSSWRDSSFPVIVESSVNESYSEYQDVHSKWTTFTKATAISKSSLDESEIIEKEDNESFSSQACSNWGESEIRKKDWEMGIQNCDPDLLFNPEKTPQGKGYFFDARKVFSENGGRLASNY